MQKMTSTNSTSQSDWMFWDRRFHHAICRAANNTLLLALLEAVQRNMDRGTWGELSEKLHGSLTPEGSMQDHMAILTSIKNRNPSAAAEAMRAHLLHLQSDLRYRCGRAGHGRGIADRSLTQEGRSSRCRLPPALSRFAGRGLPARGAPDPF